mmetsp:Transcript_10832/g.23589  ORF Transcript_10832/g.23589 Transcript_10832/m.23589 type:complete len:292 (-) Transcript_10832:1217-2092(-)
MGAGPQVPFRVPAPAHDRHGRKDRRAPLLPLRRTCRCRHCQPRQWWPALRTGSSRLITAYLGCLVHAHQHHHAAASAAARQHGQLRARRRRDGKLAHDGRPGGRGGHRPHLLQLDNPKRRRHRHLRHAPLHGLARGAGVPHRPAGLRTAKDRRGGLLQHASRAPRLVSDLGGARRVFYGGRAAPKPLHCHVRRRLAAAAGGQVPREGRATQLPVPARVPQALPRPDGHLNLARDQGSHPGLPRPHDPVAPRLDQVGLVIFFPGVRAGSQRRSPLHLACRLRARLRHHHRLV